MLPYCLPFTVVDLEAVESSSLNEYLVLVYYYGFKNRNLVEALLFKFDPLFLA